MTTPAAATGPGEWTEQLRRDGYVVVPAGAAPELCRRASADLDGFKARNRRAVTANADPAGHLVRVVTLHEVVESLQPLFAANAALAVCDEFFGAETALYTSLFFERGSEQELHRDSPAFTTRPEGRYLGMWVALDDTDSDNGPLVVVPGSHAIDPIDVTAIAVDLYGDPAAAPRNDQAGWDAYQRTVQARCAEAGLHPREVHVTTGDTIVWHPQLLHGGAPHRDGTRSRRSMVFHVTPVGTAVYGQDVFFDPARDVPATGRFHYVDCRGRRVSVTGTVDFGHAYEVRAADLHRPGDGVLARGCRALGSRVRRARRRP